MENKSCDIILYTNIKFIATQKEINYLYVALMTDLIKI